MSRNRALAAALSSLFVLGACSKDEGVAGVLVVARVEVAPPTGTLVLGNTLQLTATPKTEGGIVLPSQGLVWSSGDVNTATVSPDGVVQGVNVGGPVSIRATMDGVTGSTQITVLPFPVHHVTVSPPSANIVIGQTASFTATAFDANNQPLSGRTFTWDSNLPAVAGVTTTGLVLGVTTGGPATITATSEGKSASATVTVSNRPATRLGLLVQPSAAAAGASIAPPVQVAIQDDLLGTVTTATNAVTIALAGNPGSATLSGTRTVNAVNGIATFSNLSLNRIGNGYTLSATATGLTTATSAPFNILAGSASLLVLSTAPPSTTRSGVAFAAAPTVQLRDASGNNVATAGVSISATASGSGILGGTVTAVTNGAGLATFPGMGLSGTVGTYTITFSATGFVPVTSGNIALTAGLPSALSITTQPATTAQSGVALTRQPVVRLLDAWNNPVSQAGVAVTAAIASGPGSLGGSTTVTTSSTGVATFSGLALTGAAGSYTLQFSGTGLTSVTSSGITLSAGAAASVGIVTQPSATAVNGAVFATQPSVRLLDASGNPVSQSGVLVSVSIQTGPTGSLGGTTTRTTNSSGVATFTNLSITGAVGTRTLLFAASGFVSVSSTGVTITPGPATKLVVAVQPSTSAASGTPFAQQPAIQLQDGSGNPVGQAGVVVTASIATGTGTLGGTVTASTDAAGLAAFTDLSLTGNPGSFTLGFAGTGLAPATSGTIVLGAGAASQLAITTQPPGTASSGVAFTTAPVVQLLDGLGNPSAQSGVQVTVVLASGTGTLNGTLVVATDNTGKATFTGLSITGPAGLCTLSFSAPSMTPVTSTAITLGAGAPTQLAVTTQPPANAASGAAFTTAPVVQLLDAGGNPSSQSGVSVTVALASGSGTLSGVLTATTDNTGKATFPGLSIAGKVGNYTLSFTAPSMTPAASATIALGPGPASQMIWVIQPQNPVKDTKKFAPQPVIQLLDAAGNPVAGISVTAAVVSCSAFGNAVLNGTLTVISDATGTATYTDLSLNRGALHTTCNLSFTAQGTQGPLQLLFAIDIN